MRPKGLYAAPAWTFSRGDRFHWVPFGTNLMLIAIEDGRGTFVEAKGLDGPVVNGAEMMDWPLDEHYLQMLHITKIGANIYGSDLSQRYNHDRG